MSLAERDASGLVNVASRDVFSKADLIRGFAEKMELPVNGRSGSIASQQVPRADSLALDPSRAEVLLGRSMPSLNDTLERLAEDFASPCPRPKTNCTET